MSKKWKDSLPEVDDPSLEWAATHLVAALRAHRVGNAELARATAGRAAANIRGVRKSLGVDSERRELGADLTGAELLWAASGKLAIAALRLPDEPGIVAWHLRGTEACIRTYMREASS